MQSYAFYECHDCKKPYFGGVVNCQQQFYGESTDKENLRCQHCQLKDFAPEQGNCEKHGRAYIDWKCNYCCSVASFFCFGTTYFCSKCHARYPNQLRVENCDGEHCPLEQPHPPAHKNVVVSTYPLGCALCRSERITEQQYQHMNQEEVMDPQELDW